MICGDRYIIIAKRPQADASIQIKNQNMRQSQVGSGLLRFARNDGGEMLAMTAERGSQ
jgi:hypothetical protein